MILPAVLALALALMPRWLDRTLAGYALASDQGHGVVGIHDAKRGFYLVRTNDCDGAIVTLTLTRDRNVVAELGYAVPNFKPRTGENGSQTLVDKPLPSLTTGRGIAIGDAPASVRLRLGGPTKTKRYPPYQDFVYATRMDDEAKTRHEQRYTFKDDRLIEVEFTRDASAE